MTDNASNFKVAFTGYRRLPCACHMVAAVLNRARPVAYAGFFNGGGLVTSHRDDVEYVIAM